MVNPPTLRIEFKYIKPLLTPQQNKSYDTFVRSGEYAPIRHDGAVRFNHEWCAMMWWLESEAIKLTGGFND